jgi:hypothetical protein
VHFIKFKHICSLNVLVVRWVEGDVGEVAMQVFNPMPFDIKISKMVISSALLFSGFPSCMQMHKLSLVYMNNNKVCCTCEHAINNLVTALFTCNNIVDNLLTGVHHNLLHLC